MTLRLAFSFLWLAGGVYGVVTGLRHRGYVRSLPRTPGNDGIKRQERIYFIASLIMIVIGIINLIIALRP